MGGHGGLNILPQKSWNVYNYENREKVRRDEEAAAKEEQLKRQQSRKRDAGFRLERLRSARGLSPLTKPTPESDPTAAGPAEEEEEEEKEEEESRSKNQHINLFEGIKIFDPVKEPEEWKGDKELKRMYKKAKKEEVREVTAEDEKYRMGYGLAGKGVKLPWYLERRRGDDDDGDDGNERMARGNKKEEEGKKGGKKTLKELREERLKREEKEKERERALLQEKSRRDGGFSRRR